MTESLDVVRAWAALEALTTALCKSSEEEEEEEDQISFEKVSVVHSHPPSHNISIIISMTLLDIKDDSLTCEKNKFTLSPTASIAPRSFLGPPLRRTPKIQQNHVTLPS